jgi:HPt (histidine-containing phosphotransfer) domain-containing protein
MIDKTRALRDFGISEDVLDEMLKEFIVQADGFAADIEKSTHKNDFDAAVRPAHSLKGVSGNLRLDACYKTAVSLEASVKAHDGPACKRALVELRKNIEDIKISIVPLRGI